MGSIKTSPAPANGRSLPLTTHLIGTSGRRAFAAHRRSFTTRKCMMILGEPDAIIMQHDEALLQKEGGKPILLSASVAREGEPHQDRSENDLAIAPGNIVVRDLSASVHVNLGRDREINFSLRRDLVIAAIGQDPACLDGCVLSGSQLNALLYSQFQVVAAALPSLTDQGCEVALDSLADFVLATLRLEVHSRNSREAEQSDWLWSASCQYIAANLSQAGLTATSLARALQCSRTYLYRVFADRGQTIMGYVQEQRLMASWNLLARPDCLMPVAEVAFNCGFGNPSAFTRSFRRRYGYSPSELRRQQASSINSNNSTSC